MFVMRRYREPTIDVAATADTRFGTYWCGPGAPDDKRLAEDGLGFLRNPPDRVKGPWWYRHLVWCNPPYSQCAEWMRAAIEYAHQTSATVLVLTHAATGAQWFHECADRATRVLLLTPRIQFVAPEGVTQSSNSRDSMLTIFSGEQGHLEIELANWKEEDE